MGSNPMKVSDDGRKGKTGNNNFNILVGEAFCYTPDRSGCSDIIAISSLTESLCSYRISEYDQQASVSSVILSP